MISVIITSRGRPRQAMAVIESARMLASTPTQVEFIVGCDADDATLSGYMDLASAYTTVDCAPRPMTVSMVTNRAASRAKGDTLVILGDDGVIATPHWDEAIAGYFASIPTPELRIAALNDAANPGQATLFAMDRAWIEAADGLFDERFPFWWADTAIGEVYSFVRGTGLPILQVTVATRGGNWNPRLRDMELWWALYGATRRERLETASRIRDRLGLPVPASLDDWRALWEDRDRKGLPASEEIVRLIDNPVPPDDNYLRAQAQAAAYLSRMSTLAPT